MTEKELVELLEENISFKDCPIIAKSLSLSANSVNLVGLLDGGKEVINYKENPIVYTYLPFTGDVVHPRIITKREEYSLYFLGDEKEGILIDLEKKGILIILSFKRS